MSEGLHIGNDLSCLHITYYSIRGNSDLLGKSIPQHHSYPSRARMEIPIKASIHEPHVT